MFLYQKWRLHFLLLFFAFWIIRILWSIPLVFCSQVLFPPTVMDRVLWSISIVFHPVFRYHLVPVLPAAMVYAALILSAMSRTEQFINWRYGLLSLNLSFLIKVGNNDGDYYLQKHNYFCEHWLQFIWTIVLHGPKLLVLSGAKVMNRKALAIIFDNFLRILVVRTTLSVSRFKSVNHKIDCDGQAFACAIRICCTHRSIRNSDN